MAVSPNQPSASIPAFVARASSRDQSPLSKTPNGTPRNPCTRQRGRAWNRTKQRYPWSPTPTAIVDRSVHKTCSKSRPAITRCAVHLVPAFCHSSTPQCRDGRSLAHQVQRWSLQTATVFGRMGRALTVVGPLTSRKQLVRSSDLHGCSGGFGDQFCSPTGHSCARISPSY